MKKILMAVSLLAAFVLNGCSTIETKGDVNSVNKYGKTAIISAVENSKGSVELLINSGANINARDIYGNTPLLVAILKKDTATAALLLEKGANPNVKNNYGETPIMLAAKNNDIVLVKLLVAKGVSINSKDGKGNPVLIEAVNKNSPEFVRYLIENGATVNVRDMWMNKEKTALMIAIENYASIETIDLMVAKGADLNAKDSDGNTPLMIAVERNNVPAVKLLVEKGAEKKPE